MDSTNRLSRVCPHTMLFSFFKSSSEPAETYFTENTIKTLQIHNAVKPGEWDSNKEIKKTPLGYRYIF